MGDEAEKDEVGGDFDYRKEVSIDGVKYVLFWDRKTGKTDVRNAETGESVSPESTHKSPPSSQKATNEARKKTFNPKLAEAIEKFAGESKKTI